MKKYILLIAGILPATVTGFAQAYQKELQEWQHHYREEFLHDANSPLQAKDTGYLRFFPVSQVWQVTAEVVLTPQLKPFAMSTHSGKSKRFRSYALLKFRDPFTGIRQALSAYERIDRPESDTIAATTLFIPFRDRTNGTETYGGGRYIDLKKADIKNRRIVLDFNKAYNPYCVFADGYACPIPPDENTLNIAIKAGEQLPAPPLGVKE